MNKMRENELTKKRREGKNTNDEKHIYQLVFVILFTLLLLLLVVVAIVAVVVLV